MPRKEQRNRHQPKRRSLQAQPAPTVPSDRDHPESPPPLTPIQRRPHPAMDAQMAPLPPAVTGQRSRPAAKPTSAGSPPPLAPIRPQLNVDDNGTPLLATLPATTISTEPPAVVPLEPTPPVEAPTGSSSSPRISPTWCEGLSLEDMMTAILAEDGVPTPFCLDDFQAEATLPGRGRNPSPPATGAPDESMAALRISDLTTPIANNGLMVITLASDEPMTTALATDEPVTAAVAPNESMTTVLAPDEPMTSVLAQDEPMTTAVAPNEPLTAAPLEELMAALASHEPPAASPTVEPMVARHPPVAVLGTLGAVYEDISEEEIMEISSGEDEEPDLAQDAILISDEEDNAGKTTADPRDHPNRTIARLTGASPAAAAATGTTNATPLGDARVSGIAAGGPPAVTLETTLARAGGSSQGHHSTSVATGQGNHTAPTTLPHADTNAGTAASASDLATGQRTPPRSGPPDARATLGPLLAELLASPEGPTTSADASRRATARAAAERLLQAAPTRVPPPRSADKVTAGCTMVTPRPIQRVWPLPATDEYRWRFRRAPADRDPDAPTDDRPGILRNAGRRRRASWPEEEPNSDEEASTDSEPEPEPEDWVRAPAGWTTQGGWLPAELIAQVQARLQQPATKYLRYLIEMGDTTYRVQISRGGDRVTVLPHPRGRDGV
ncbi:calphotin-like [Drosophila kikkawai]|uniref:Calphotin-like n=1 Tax=Drosophila kikkawai TaxID=30033 RepID=A0ABM4GFX4_DROKI